MIYGSDVVLITVGLGRESERAREIYIYVYCGVLLVVSGLGL